jgi:hypothetical protein
MGLLFACLLFTVFWWPAHLAYARVYTTKEEALKVAFPDSTKIEKETFILTLAQQKKVEELAKAKLETKIFIFYRGEKNNVVTGYAAFGSHVVRTKPEVYMAVIETGGSLRFIEILAFYEPEEYLPSPKWFKQFSGRTFDDELRLRKGISGISGATLSAEGIVREVRKLLAVFKVTILKKEPEKKNEIPDKRKLQE